MPHAGEDPLSYWGLVLLCDIVLLKTTSMCRCMGALPKRLKLRAPDECRGDEARWECCSVQGGGSQLRGWEQTM